MTQHPQSAGQGFGGGGEMGALMRSYDWSKTSFGAVEQWPQSLRSALSICLNSRFPIAIYWGPDCLLLYNDAWRPIVGDKHPWSLGRPAQDVWPEIWQNIGPEFAKVFATGEGIFYSDELLAMHRFGYTEECFFDYTFNPIQGESGRIEGIFNVVSETTYRVLNDRRARLLRELASKTAAAKTVEETCTLMAAALDSDPADIPLALLYLVNDEGSALCFCGGTESALGLAAAPRRVPLQPAKAEGTTLTGWPIAQVAQTGRPQTVDDLVTRFGVLPGSPWPEPPQEARILPVVVPGQASVAAVLVAVASPRRRLDDNYRDFFEQLAGQLATAIANARSHEEAQRRAEQLAELDRAKTVFFSNVSHEFRTPLTLMLGPVQEALQHAQDDQQRDRLELVQRNALRLQKLVNTLLDFSRIEAGRIEAVYEPTDLARLTTDLAGVFRSAIEQAGLQLFVDCAPLPEPAYVDREMWEKIVLNLLSNAFKFTFEGAIAVTLRPGPDHIRLEVSDTGTGIPAPELPHIFERFHRVQGARGRTHEGSGIGLALVQELVELHGGTIGVTSQVGQGTQFTVTLPTGYAHLPGDRLNAPRTQPSTATGATPYLEETLAWPLSPTSPISPTPPISPLTPTPLLPTPPLPHILLADDNADMLDYVKRLLSQRYQVQTVRDGRAALAAIQQQPPDLVLTDVMMPVLDGFELLRQLRADPQTRDLPIILLSARAGDESRLEGLTAGADDYLIKPFSAQELLARVEASLKLAQLRQESRAMLQRSEERSRLAVQVAHLGTWHYDPATNLVELDARMRDIWGEPADGPPLPLHQVVARIHPEDLERIAGAVRTALDPASPGTYEMDYRIVWNDGTERWIAANGQALFAGEGEGRRAAEFLGTALDITERKQTELLLAEQTRLLGQVAAGCPLDDCLLAICTTIARLNSRVRACFLLTDGQQQFSRPITPHFPPSFRDELRDTPINELCIGTCGEAVCSGQPITCADMANDDRWSPGWREVCLAHNILACHSTPVLGVDGLAFGSLMMCFEQARLPTAWEYQLADFGTQVASIAFERDRASLALRDSEHRYRTLFESMDEGFCICEMLFDADGKPVDYRFLEINPTFETLTGQQQVVGKTALELSPDLDPFWIETYGRIVLTGEPQQFEHEAPIMDRWFDVSAFAIGEPQSHRFAILFTDISDRRKVERERERFLAVGSDLQVITGSDGYFQWASPTFERVLGWTAAEMVGRPWVEFVHPDDRPKSVGETDSLFRGDKTLAFENRYRHKDGSYRWFLWNAQPYLADQVVYGAAIDITDLKQTEEALRQRETELRLVTNAVPALITFIDADQRYRFNNQGYEDWFGQSTEDIYGKHIKDVAGEAAYEQVRPYVERVLAGQQVTFERAVQFKDGSNRYLSVTYVPRVSDQGQVEGFVALINDISDRKQAEAALRQSEERYRYLVESIPQLVWTANAEGAIIDVNQRWSAFTGLTLDQIKTQGWQAVVHPEDAPILGQNWAAAQQTGTNYQAEGRMRRADGVYRWHLHQAVPLRTAQGQVSKWFGTATDIEDQKQLEHQRSQLLKQEQAARAAAEAASRTKDEFLAVVSHELRSPLNPILGWATLLQRGTLDATKTQQALAVIERNARLQTELIDDLLDVSRMLRGKLEINASTVHLAATIRAAIDTVRLAAEAKSIQLDTCLDDDIGLVSGDATRLQQVVWNLLSNAVKFTPAGGRVEVRLARGANHQAEIIVTDTGKGIVPEFLPLIFDYFRQADSATTRQFGGLGLGLAIVRHLVELHGGTIEAKSPGEGLGATFTVRLPTLPTQPDSSSEAQPKDLSPGLQGTRVLVVDDDTDTRNFVTFLLEQAGAKVVSVATAVDALAALGQAQPQILVSDVGMPEMDGYMLMRQIRALPAEAGGQVPAIALTAYARESDQNQALAAGFQRHISKPVQPAALIQAIAELIQ